MKSISSFIKAVSNTSVALFVIDKIQDAICKYSIIEICKHSFIIAKK